MPLKSKAQLRKLGELVKEGKMSQDKFQEFLDATPSIETLPERVEVKPKESKTGLTALVKKGRTAQVIK